MIKLYSTNCPKCMVLKVKLKNKNIPYEEITDRELMAKKGIDTVPILEVENHLMSFTESINFVKNWGEV